MQTFILAFCALCVVRSADEDKSKLPGTPTSSRSTDDSPNASSFSSAASTASTSAYEPRPFLPQFDVALDAPRRVSSDFIKASGEIWEVPCPSGYKTKDGEEWSDLTFAHANDQRAASILAGFNEGGDSAVVEIGRKVPQIGPQKPGRLYLCVDAKEMGLRGFFGAIAMLTGNIDEEIIESAKQAQRKVWTPFQNRLQKIEEETGINKHDWIHGMNDQTPYTEDHERKCADILLQFGYKKEEIKDVSGHYVKPQMVFHFAKALGANLKLWEYSDKNIERKSADIEMEIPTRALNILYCSIEDMEAEESTKNHYRPLMRLLRKGEQIDSEEAHSETLLRTLAQHDTETPEHARYRKTTPSFF